MTMRNPERHLPRPNSSFSNKNLTILESLVLEIALEDANHKGCSVKDCEMTEEDYQKIARLPGNDCCADCQSPDTEWASVTYGILLCADCSGVHRALGTHISRVRSIKMDNWSQEQLEIMRAGGNRSCRRYLESYGVDLEQELKSIYTSEAAINYRKYLNEKVLKRQEKLDETESSSNSEDNEEFLASESKSTYKAADDESCASFAGESVVEVNNKHERATASEQAAILEEHSTQDDNTADKEEQGTRRGSEASLPMSLDTWFSAFSGDRGDAEKEKKKETRASEPSLPMVLDAWFGAVRGMNSNHSKNSNGLMVQSTHSGTRRRVVRSKSSSTPTITYLGRSFAADRPQDCNSQFKQKIRSISDLRLLAELAEHQEAIARDNLNDSWRWEIPSTSCHWSSAKKVEPFDASTYHGFSTSSSSHAAATERSKHHEALRRKMTYTDEDLLRIVKDEKEFARLKAGLKSRGAVTNEVLKQKLHAFVIKSKMRNESLEKVAESRNRNSKSRGTETNTPRSSDTSKGLRAKTIHTNTSQRL